MALEKLQTAFVRRLSWWEVQKRGDEVPAEDDIASVMRTLELDEDCYSAGASFHLQELHFRAGREVTCDRIPLGRLKIASFEEVGGV